MKIIIIVLFIVFLFSFIHADVVYLKDSSKIEGEIERISQEEVVINVPVKGFEGIYEPKIIKKIDIDRIEKKEVNSEEKPKETESVKQKTEGKVLYRGKWITREEKERLEKQEQEKYNKEVALAKQRRLGEGRESSEVIPIIRIEEIGGITLKLSQNYNRITGYIVFTNKSGIICSVNEKTWRGRIIVPYKTLSYTRGDCYEQEIELVPDNFSWYINNTIWGIQIKNIPLTGDFKVDYPTVYFEIQATNWRKKWNSHYSEYSDYR